jgi:DNA-binding transcriptional LysR family regulator
MALGELENQLGGALFDRHGRSLLLNDRGRYLLPMAKEITHKVWNVESMLTEARDLVAGSLEIVASSTIGNYVLPYLIGAFMRIHPESRINMTVANTTQAEKLVSQGVMDLGFVE